MVERKLTTILAADVTGYGRLMGEDEPGTLATLKSYRETMAGFIASHRGRVVNTAGDSLLAEFASVVEAVQCAVSIQRELAARNEVLSPGRRMLFRIGLNLGDVMVEGDDLFGEGVNIAARLQAVAEPGGICISGTVFDQVKNKLSIGYDFLGRQAIKNIADEVPIYRIKLSPDDEPGPEAPPPQSPPASVAGAADRRRQRFYHSAAIAGVAVLAVFAVNMMSGPSDLWFQWPTLAIAILLALRALRLFGPGAEGEEERRAGRRRR
jgi:adenylate cyclase